MRGKGTTGSAAPSVTTVKIDLRADQVRLARVIFPVIQATNLEGPMNYS